MTIVVAFELEQDLFAERRDKQHEQQVGAHEQAIHDPRACAAQAKREKREREPGAVAEVAPA